MTRRAEASRAITGPSIACERLRELAQRQRTQTRRHALEAVERGLKAADPAILLRRQMRRKAHYLTVGPRKFLLSKFDRILLVGGGKAAAGMALEVGKILGDKVTGGAVNVPDYLNLRKRHGRTLFHPATHPLPTDKGVSGVEKMLELVEHPSRDDLVICVLSGGGSALMPSPVPGLTLEDLRKTTELLLKAGTRIDELNMVRKHLSSISGGRLAERLYPATVISLIISDVVGDRAEDIASGPTAPDSSSYVDARAVLRKYGLEKRVPLSIRQIFDKGVSGSLPETPKPGSRVFARVHNMIVGSSRDSCAAATQALQEKGYRTIVLSTMLQGEARHVGTFLASILADRGATRFSLTRSFAVVAGGETTVTVRGNGLGGRNQELVLSAALQMRGLRNAAIASIATDGVDGVTPAAGAIADGGTVGRLHQQESTAETFLENNDSFHFLQKVDELIITGPTGTNVNDLVAAVSRKDDSNA